MNKVKSFLVDHTKLKPGIYLSKVNGCFTYDVRFIEPIRAKAEVPSGEVLHTLEHFFAFWFREKSAISNAVLYVGPMGCKTGFYVLLSEHISEQIISDNILAAASLLLKSDTIPGASALSCGNYEYFDLSATKKFVLEVVIPTMSSNPLNTSYPLIL